MAAAVVFRGPTLTADEVEARRVESRPPVALGDVYDAVRAGATVVGIVDGYFERLPAVWHKEILWALDRGVRVYGAASMGALRAAELAPFGMVGVGGIYADFVSGTLTDDDEVAVAHGLGEDGFAATSEAMVNIRATLARAVDEGVLGAEEACRLVGETKALFYPDRSWPAVVGRARSHDPDVARRLRAWLPQGRVDRKHEDAVALLDEVSRTADDDATPVGAAFEFERTRFWESARREFAHRSGGAPADRVYEEAVVAGDAAGANEATAVVGSGGVVTSVRDRTLEALRRDGDYDGLEARAADKERALVAKGLSEPDWTDLGVDRGELLRWWFGERGASVPADLATHARRLGLGEAAFLRMVRRERAYVPADRPAHVVVEQVLDEVDLSRLDDLWKRGHPYEVLGTPTVQRRAASTTRPQQSGPTSGAPSAAVHYAVKLNRGLVGDDGRGAARSIYYRRPFAMSRRVLVDGVEPLLWSTHLREAAHTLVGRDAVLEPAYIIANVMLPGQELAAHHDVPEFRGLGRQDCPGWLLVVAQRSKLFEDYRAKVASAIVYAGETGGGGELALWEQGPDGPPTLFAPDHGTAVVADVDDLLHGVLPVAGGPPPERSGPGARIRHVGHDRWVAELDGRLLGHYRSRELRFSMVWKMFAFADEDDRSRWYERRDPLTVAHILDVLTDELRRRGRIGSTRPPDDRLGQLLIDEFVKVPELPTPPHGDGID